MTDAISFAPHTESFPQPLHGIATTRSQRLGSGEGSGEYSERIGGTENFRREIVLANVHGTVML